MTPVVRRQLTLFLPPTAAELVEAVRRVVDPVQQALIAAHVTLGREDEIASLDQDTIADRLARAPRESLRLSFGAPRRFSGHGLLVECLSGGESYDALRERILGHRPEPRTAHITLAHPRNPEAPGNSLEATRPLMAGLTIALDQVSLIEQVGRDPWRTLARWPLV